jgi:hypothetical protein
VGAQLVTRPSPFVRPVNFNASGDNEEGGLDSVRVTGILAAGRPRVVSRTWHVIGGLASAAAMVVAVSGVRWDVRAARRWGAEVGMRIETRYADWYVLYVFVYRYVGGGVEIESRWREAWSLV